MEQQAPAVTPAPEATSAAPAPETEPAADNSNAKLFAIIGYIIPFLFFIPLVQDDLKTNKFSRFHANQQLILLIAWVSFWVLSNVFFMILYFIWFAIAPLMYLAFLVFAILGIINAAKMEMKALPLIGGITLIK